MLSLQHKATCINKPIVLPPGRSKRSLRDIRQGVRLAPFGGKSYLTQYSRDERVSALIC